MISFSGPEHSDAGDPEFASYRLKVADLADSKGRFVIDDDPSIQKGMQRLLTAHGFEVVIFKSVEEFENRSNRQNAVCAVMDINLNGASGIDLRYRLAQSGSSLPVIFITADDTGGMRTAALAAGCVAYLTKPVLAARPPSRRVETAKRRAASGPYVPSRC